MKKIDGCALLVVVIAFILVGSTGILVVACRALYSGKVDHGGLVELVVVPREMRDIPKLIKLNPSKVFYEAGELEGFYSLTYEMNKLNEDEMWHLIEDVARRNNWELMGYQQGVWGRTLNFFADRLNVDFFSDGDTIKMTVRHKM